MARLFMSKFCVRRHNLGSSSRGYLETKPVNSKESRGLYRLCVWCSVCILHVHHDFRLFSILTLCSACVAAALRIVTSVQYLSSTDKTFIISAVTMCCWAEMVLLFVVVCVPTLPKVIVSLGLPKMFSSLRTWALSYRSKTQSSNGTGSRTRPAYEASGRSAYQQIDEYILNPLNHSSRDMYSAQSSVHVPQDASILRTTHFTATEEYTRNVDDFSYQRQHPWAAQG